MCGGYHSSQCSFNDEQLHLFLSDSLISIDIGGGGVMCGGSLSSQCPFNDRQWRLPLPLELPHIHRYLYWGVNNKYPPMNICLSALKACPHLSLETIRKPVST